MKMKVRTDVQSREIAAQHTKMILMLENRVEVATKRFNLVIAENAKLRGEIETLLKERAQFMLVWNKLIGQLNTGKQIINDLIEQATVTFNQRDEELNKIQALRERYRMHDARIFRVVDRCRYRETRSTRAMPAICPRHRCCRSTTTCGVAKVETKIVVPIIQMILLLTTRDPLAFGLE